MVLWDCTRPLQVQNEKKQNTVWWHYNMVNFRQNRLKRLPIAHLWGWGMGCLLCVSSLIHILMMSLQCPVYYHDKWNHIITALDCNTWIEWICLFCHMSKFAAAQRNNVYENYLRIKPFTWVDILTIYIMTSLIPRKLLSMLHWFKLILSSLQ